MKILVNSFPKSGTNLIEKLMVLADLPQTKKTIALSSVLGRYQSIKQATRVWSCTDYTIPVGIEVPVGVKSSWLKGYIKKVPNNTYFTGHAAWSDHLDQILTQENIKVIFIIRDPRAILTSMAKYVIEDINKWYPFHNYFKALEINDLIRTLITGKYIEDSDMYYSGINESLKRVEGWLNSPNAIVIKFEDIVGSKGGGNDEMQQKSIEDIFEFIGIYRSHSEICKIQKELFGGTHTFRGGKIDSWKKEFTPELNQLINKELSNNVLCTSLNYI